MENPQVSSLRAHVNSLNRLRPPQSMKPSAGQVEMVRSWLKRLAHTHVDVYLLRESEIGKAVNAPWLRKHEDSEVRRLSKELVDRWKAVARTCTMSTSGRPAWYILAEIPKVNQQLLRNWSHKAFQDMLDGFILPDGCQIGDIVDFESTLRAEHAVVVGPGMRLIQPELFDARVCLPAEVTQHIEQPYEHYGKASVWKHEGTGLKALPELRDCLQNLVAMRFWSSHPVVMKQFGSDLPQTKKLTFTISDLDGLSSMYSSTEREEKDGDHHAYFCPASEFSKIHQVTGKCFPCSNKSCFFGGFDVDIGNMSHMVHPLEHGVVERIKRMLTLSELPQVSVSLRCSIGEPSHMHAWEHARSNLWKPHARTDGNDPLGLELESRPCIYKHANVEIRHYPPNVLWLGGCAVLMPEGWYAENRKYNQRCFSSQGPGGQLHEVYALHGPRESESALRNMIKIQLGEDLLSGAVVLGRKVLTTCAAKDTGPARKKARLE